MKRNPRTVRRGATVGLAIASVALLTACGTTQGGGDRTAARPPPSSARWRARSRSSRGPATSRTGRTTPAVDWVTPFEEDTGCEVTTKTFGTSDEALNLMKTGDYDVVSASGDASLRLVAAGDVAPVNTDLIPNYENIYDFLKDQAWNTVDGVPYGVPHGYGANLLMYNTEVFPTAPTSWDVVFDESGDYAGKVTAYDSPIYIADAAVYLMAHNPELGIENPYALDEEQLAAAVDLLKQQRENIGEYWSDYLKEIQAFTTGDTVVGTSWQVIQNVLEGEGATTAGRAARRGHDRMVRHLDDLVRVEEPELRVRVARLHRQPRGERGGDRVLRRGAVERRGLRVPRGLRGVPRR